MRRACRALLDMALPPICRGCGHRILPHDPGPLCFACRDSIPRITPSMNPCKICGTPHPIAAADGRCRQCFDPGPLDRLACGALYQGLANVAVERFKYGHRTEYGPLLAEWMGPSLELLDPESKGVLLPIPLHRSRERERGFNQAELLASILSKTTNRRVCTDLLVRNRATPAQARLTKKERATNVHGAFSLSPTAELPQVDGQPRPVILVDDVATTGATLQAAARALSPLNPPQILALTACRASLVIS